jgi:hypothetical protein
LSDDKHDTW